MRSIPWFALAAAVAACGNQPAKPAPAAMNPDSMRAGVQAILGRFNTVMQQKDAAALAAMYAPDATWILPDGSVSKGHDAILATATEFFKTFDSASAQPAAIDAFFPVDSTDAVVFAEVPYKMWVKGKASSHVNYFATHFIKSGGTWLAHHDLNVDAVVKDSTKKP